LVRVNTANRRFDFAWHGFPLALFQSSFLFQLCVTTRFGSGGTGFLFLKRLFFLGILAFSFFAKYF